MPETEKACRARLKGLGAEFEDRPAEGDTEAGCSMPFPILLTRLTKEVKVEPGALLNCATAEAAATFTISTLQPLSREVMTSDLVSLSQASAYVCRPRHGTNKLSEHAFGNALDIGSFSFADKTELSVSPVPGDKGEEFLREVRKRACGPFKTVLGPGSDADHATHLHLDLAERKNGGTFCQ
ncbi:extensin family protein [Mesorhizobium sp. RP14(2022)]|uniref:Extensin family protein n=2 Tax=Mesorhizobium liriopis TaxID=2953882 RepID=A0ABT1C5E2_9HYPH|nr:extensin family protein [Mesorhizobium liriopis]